MNTDWKQFLTEAGAHFEGEWVSGFGDPASEPAAVLQEDIIADLSHFGVLRAAGEDAQTFLQGQLTNDVRQVSPGQSQLSAYCSPKGRILSDFRIFMRDGDYLLRLPAVLSEGIRKRLSMFILRAKVTLDDAGGELLRVGVSGPHVESLLRPRVGQLPAAADEVVTSGGLTVIRVPGTQPRFEIYAGIDELKALWRELASKVRAVGRPAWCLLDLRAGIPAIHQETYEAFVPQMVNLHLLKGVSFRKGCYTGQEIVARMQYLGKLKRRMYLAHVDAPMRPQPGDGLFAPTTESGQGTGKVVEACPAPGGGFDLLAVIQISDAEAGDVRLGDENGPALQFMPLPYAFDVEGDAVTAR